MKKPKTPVEALTLALVLSVIAPTDEKAAMVLAMAEKLAATLSEIEIKQALRAAEKQLEQEEVLT